MSKKLNPRNSDVDSEAVTPLYPLNDSHVDIINSVELNILISGR
jgi:hypothetical protein